MGYALLKRIRKKSYIPKEHGANSEGRLVADPLVLATTNWHLDVVFVDDRPNSKASQKSQIRRILNPETRAQNFLSVSFQSSDHHSSLGGHYGLTCSCD
jgi:hypothetical protein